MKIIAEFDTGEDAMLFARAKFARDGGEYRVTAGLDRPFAVRRVERKHAPDMAYLVRETCGGTA